MNDAPDILIWTLFPQAWKHRSDSGSGIWSRQHCQVIISQTHPSLSFWWIYDKPLTKCKVLYHTNLILSCSIYIQSLQLTLEWKDLRPTQFWLWFYYPYNCSCFLCLQRVIYWSTLLYQNWADQCDGVQHWISNLMTTNRINLKSHDQIFEGPLFINIVEDKHCQRHYGPRRWLLWPVILVW